jgi:hypothetical protein
MGEFGFVDTNQGQRNIAPMKEEREKGQDIQVRIQVFFTGCFSYDVCSLLVYEYGDGGFWCAFSCCCGFKSGSGCSGFKRMKSQFLIKNFKFVQDFQTSSHPVNCSRKSNHS